jgi:hypothetical protein
VPGRSYAANFGTWGKRVDSTREYIQIALIINDTPTTVEVGIGGLEALQLGVDGSELAAGKVPSRDSSTTMAIFVLTSARKATSSTHV